MDTSTLDSFLSQVPGRHREAVEALLKAQQDGLRVSITEGGVSGSTVGRISDIRIVNRELVFKVEGKDYKPFYGISVEVLGKHVEIRTPSDVVQNAPAFQRQAVEALLKAQEDGLRVSITEGGVSGNRVGRISDVRIVNGELVFKVEGKDYRPFYGISVEILGKHVEIRP